MATIMQKRAFEEIVGKGRTAVGPVLLEVGYSPSMVDHPNRVTESDGWKELMEQYLPDDKLARINSEGLEAMKLEGKQKVADHSIRHRFLETAYRIKDKMPKEGGSGGPIFNFFGNIAHDQLKSVAIRLAGASSDGSDGREG